MVSATYVLDTIRTSQAKVRGRFPTTLGFTFAQQQFTVTSCQAVKELWKRQNYKYNDELERFILKRTSNGEPHAVCRLDGDLDGTVLQENTLLNDYKEYYDIYSCI